MNQLIVDAITPFKSITKKTFTLFIVIDVTLILALWYMSPLMLLPKPHEVIASMLDLFMNEDLVLSVWTSFKLNIKSILIATVLSLSISYAYVIPIARPIVTFISSLRFLSMAGLVVAFVEALSGTGLQIGLLVFGETTFFVTSMAAVVASVPEDEIDYARTLRFPSWKIVWEVIVLGKMDQAIELLRQNQAMGWMMLTMVEGLVRAGGGIGKLLLDENKHYQIGKVYAIQVILLLVGLCMDIFITWSKKKICPHTALNGGKK
jgi:NitT/TauT family transport system permease protein